MKNFILVLVFVGIGLAAALMGKRFLQQKFFQVQTSKTSGLNRFERFNASLVHQLPDFLGLFLFVGTAYSAYFLFQSIDSAVMQLTFLAILISVSIIRTLAILSRLFLSPAMPDFRILPIECGPAGQIHRLILGVFSYITVTMMFTIVVEKLGAMPQTVSFLQLLFITLLLLATAAGIVIFKDKVKQRIIERDGDTQNKGWGAAKFAGMWHYLAILYLMLLWLLLVVDIANPDSSKGAFLLSFFIVPVWMVTDRLAQWIISYVMKILKIHQDEYEDDEAVDEQILLARENGERFYLKVRRMTRVATAAFLGIWLAGMWNIQIPFVSGLAAVVLDAAIIMTLALLFWQFISSWIERKIQESIPDSDEEEEEEDEWGSASKMGRSFTLLPMLRKFIASVLVVMVTLTILSSFGVNIGPLLAGAGVVGLAVGFGAQKLVSDVFSGFFYLFDDAFRVGEYIKAAAVSGTVETITLRNVMLRHHRGMLQIVPHSDLGAITNFMRGGITVKFNLDFPYDSNINKIRKIIKKVGKAMLKNEEYGKDFIRPVKSQGVRDISNSVMTIRAKFTAQPGTHFVIRREAYKNITEALKAQGIHYAHKKVIVDIPDSARDDPGHTSSRESVKKQIDNAGAAALAAIHEDEKKAAEEAAKQTKA